MKIGNRCVWSVREEEEGRIPWESPFSFLPIFRFYPCMGGEVKSHREMANRLKDSSSDSYTGTIFRTPFSYRTS